MQTLIRKMRITMSEGKGYAAAISAIHTHSIHHLELLRILESKHKELQINTEV